MPVEMHSLFQGCLHAKFDPMPELDRVKWDGIYAERDEVGEPSEFLERALEFLPPRGRVLDFAGGSGRNGLFLAQRGYDVTIADVSPVALSIAKTVATQRGLEVHAVEVDLEESPFPQGPWDVILDFNFLFRPLFAELPSLLAADGMFVFCQPTMTNLEKHEHPSARFLLDQGEVAELVARAGRTPARAASVAWSFEGWSKEGRHEAELVLALPHVAELGGDVDSNR